ncbi:META domain-containing protein [Agromyces sp. NPDC060279]|uniref:META domain-containing protein n=1 Tax=Agromyces sp. NPDC060279 TaxID=3347092 RepID=UPI00364FDDD9
MRFWRAAAIAAFGLLALSGCVGQSDGDSERPSLAPPAESGDARAATAPAQLRPAETEDLVGRWVEPEPPNPGAFVAFADDGTWEASDGCNGAIGTWSVEGGGFATDGERAMTLIGCNNSVLPLPVWSAISAAVDPEAHTLVLTDADGAPFELVRADETERQLR